MLECERCQDQPAVRCTAATAYADDDLNQDSWFCYDCRDEYYEYWAERWNEYNREIAAGIYAIY